MLRRSKWFCKNIAAYINHRTHRKTALRLRLCTLPHYKTFSNLLQLCRTENVLRQAHAQILSNGFIYDIYLLTMLVDCYAKLGFMEDARQLFDNMPTKDSFLWNVMIRGYKNQGLFEKTIKFYDEMQGVGTKPDKYTFPFVLKACGAAGDVHKGRKVYADAIEECLHCDAFVSSSAILMFSRCGDLESARQIFEKMPRRNVVAWSSLISGLVQNGEYGEALEVFQEMQLVDNLVPNSITVARILPASELQHGKEIHAWIIREGLLWDLDVGIGLAEMYSRFSMDYARKVFDCIASSNDVMLWNVIIRGYAASGPWDEALILFQEMRVHGIDADAHTFPFLVKACSQLLDLPLVRQIHGQILKEGFADDVFVGNSLVSAYAKCKKMQVAHKLFDSMVVKDVVSWSALVEGYVVNEKFDKGLECFHKMQCLNVKANRVTCLSTLSACSAMAALQQGKQVHAYVIACGFHPDVLVDTAIINLYAKCGSLRYARKKFDTMVYRTTASWNAMIYGYGICGMGLEALDIFNLMQMSNLKPDSITFICLLSACSHAGLFDEARLFFQTLLVSQIGFEPGHSHLKRLDFCSSTDPPRTPSSRMSTEAPNDDPLRSCLQNMTVNQQVLPKMEHYGCMVDLLGRAGHLNDAWNLIQSMPFKPGASVLRALLRACKMHGNLELREQVAKCLFQIDQEKGNGYVELPTSYITSPQQYLSTASTELVDKRSKTSAGKAYIELITHLMHAA